jgi:hypothetical protein
VDRFAGPREQSDPRNDMTRTVTNKKSNNAEWPNENSQMTNEK